MTGHVAVIVVTYNSSHLIGDLVESLHIGLDGVDWHVTFADNASADDTVEQIRRSAPEAQIVETGRNRGYAAGINAAHAATGAHTAVLVLNPDVRLRPSCVATLLTELRRPGVGIVVPRLVDGDGELIWSQRREPTVTRALAAALFGAERAGLHSRTGEVVTAPELYERRTTTDWAEGSTWLVSSDCWNACGEWDERYFLYAEETDYALRARDLGFATRYVPGALAVHLEGDSGTSPKMWPLVVLNSLRLFSRRHARLHTVAFWFALVLREGSRAILGRPIHQAGLRALLSPSRIRETPGPHSIR